MKNIEIYKAGKYDSDKYEKVKENIYKTYDSFMDQDAYVTSLSFEQEPEYEEGADSSDIEDIEKLLQIVGKHVYNGTVEKDGKSYIKLFIE